MIELNISSRRTGRWLLLALGILFVLQWAINLAHLVAHRRFAAFTELFDMDREGNVPVFYNCFLFFFCSFLFYLNGRSHEGREARPWKLMAGVFIFLGIDEGSQIHEKLMLPTIRLLNHGQQTGTDMGWLYYAWYIPYGAAALVLLLVLTPWLLRMEKGLRARLLGTGVVYVTGAVVLEALSGKVAERDVTISPEQLSWLPCEVYDPGQCHLYANWRYVATYTAEETMEMLGLILCAMVLISVLEKRKITFVGRMGGTGVAQAD